jgi:peptide subunit release factor 1 (eRF1)
MFDQLVFEPKLPLKSCMYRCDSKFHLDELLDMYQDYPTFGVVFTDGNLCDMYQVRAARWLKIDDVDVFLQGQFKNGGQSANRLQRKRDILRGWNLTRIAEDLVELFFDRENQAATVKALVLCGPAQFKQQLAAHKLVQSYFREGAVVVYNIASLDKNLLNGLLVELEANDPVAQKSERELEQLIRDCDERLLFGAAEVEQALADSLAKVVFTNDKTKFAGRDFGYRLELVVLPCSSKLMAQYEGLIGLKFY